MDNTVNFNLRSVGYKQFLYPAGEMQVRLTEESIERVKKSDYVTITVNGLHDTSALMELLLLTDAIRGISSEYKEITWMMPYYPYARADRRFTEGDCYGLKVFSKLITASNIVTLDIHSTTAIFMSYVPLKNVNPEPLIYQAMAMFMERDKEAGWGKPMNLTVLFPDKGAAARYKLDDQFGPITIKKVYATKVRDKTTGVLLGFNVPDVSGENVLIVDDICDGGGTFVGIANLIASKAAKLGLYTTHGLYSKGLTELQRYFGKNIYTTNSVHPSFHDMYPVGSLNILDCYPLMYKKALHDSTIGTSNTCSGN